MGVLDDTLIFYLLGDNGASGEGGPRGTFREHLVGHGIQDDTADMAARLDTLGDPTTYAIYPAGWALAMNTPYPWTKQVAHLGGTRDGMIVRWGNGIAARGEIRHQWHHVIDVLPTILEAAGLPGARDVRRRRRSSRSRAPACATRFDDADAPDRHTTQYFEMIGNRGIYHEGWTAVTRHGIPWEMVDTPEAALRRGRLGALRPRGRLEPGPRPRRASSPSGCASCRSSSSARPRSTTCSRSTTGSPSARTPRSPAGSTCTSAASSLSFGPRVGRLTEEAAPNVKNRSHVITADLEVVTGTNGVVVAQGGRFGGWSLYVVDGVPHYAYNFVGRDLTVVRGGKPMAPGRHDLVVRFDYDGGPPGSGADVTPRGRRRGGRHRPDPGDDGLLLLLRRDLQRRRRPRHAGRSTTTCRCATGSRG